VIALFDQVGLSAEKVTAELTKKLDRTEKDITGLQKAIDRITVQ
jgi:chaperonin cofactor prefoldin